LPRWLKRRLPAGGECFHTARLVRELKLATVCEQAACPNRPECYAAQTATFLLLGEVCTRNCGFCGVRKGVPEPPVPDEPWRVAEAVCRLGLKHVVLTAVARDDLPDGGADHFAQTVLAVRAATGATVEVLPSDFAGNPSAVERLVAAAPDVYNHNCETVPRLFCQVRGPRADYRWTLEMFRRIRRLNPGIWLKTGLMLGLGETFDELSEVLAELRAVGCTALTLGQYLRPSPAHLPVVRYVSPDEFMRLGELARRIGFSQVAAGPLVRSSYHAREMFTSSSVGQRLGSS
jgi:lipoic acid synthetase